MKLDHIFLLFMIVCGAIAGSILVAAPQVAKFIVPPYFWLLIAMIAFEGFAHWPFGGAPGSLLSLEFRLIALVAGVAAMFAIPYVAGVQITML